MTIDRRPLERRRVADARKRLGLVGTIGVFCCILQSQARADDIDTSAFAPTGLAPTGSAGNGLSPDTTTSRIGDLRSFVDGPPANQPADRQFTFTPAIGVQELLTDNVYQIAKPRVADLVTSITPELAVSGQTPHLQANVIYAPDIQLYARTSRQDQVAEHFNGQALLTAIPDTLFLDLRGYANQQSANGNSGQNGAPYYSSPNRSNTLSFEASPYVTHRFGGDGTIQAGFIYNYTSTTGASPFAVSNQQQSLFNDNFTNQNLNNGSTRSKEEYATFTSGENFGRVSDSLRLDATQYTSTGGSVLSGARRTTAIDNFGYGLNRTIALLGSAGYEDINYAGIPPTRIKDAVWSGGFRLTPNQESSLTLRYGHKDGFNSVTFSASYAVTARLRVFANYSEGLTSTDEEIQNNLNTTTVDQYGNSVDIATGAPTLISDEVLSPQNDLYRLKRFTTTAITTYDRDSFSLSVEQETRRIVSVGFGAAAFSDQAVSGSLSWNHEITPNLLGTASVHYGVSSGLSGNSLNARTIGLFLQTSYALTPTLTANLEYYVTKQSSNQAGSSQFVNSFGQNYLQNAVLIGLRKSL